MDIFDLRRHNVKKQIMEGVRKKICLDVGPNILNLKQWIPQKDVIRLILMYLKKVDWKLVWAAHNKRHEQELIQNNKFWWLCVHEGYLKVLMWGDGLGVQCFRSTILDIAAQKGYIDMFWWGMYEKGFRPNKNTVYCAIRWGRIEMLEFLKFHDFSVLFHTRCSVAATFGQLDVIKWLISNGFGWDEDYTMIEATRNNHIHILKWAKENGCPCDWELLANIAAKDKNVSAEVRQWIDEQ